MGLKATTTKALVSAFNTSLADAVKAFTYRVTEITFDDATNTTVETVTDYTSRGVFGYYNEKLVKDESVLDIKVKVIILQDELEVVPAKNQKIITSEKTYVIERLVEDPADIVWELQCRE